MTFQQILYLGFNDTWTLMKVVPCTSPKLKVCVHPIGILLSLMEASQKISILFTENYKVYFM